MKKWLTGIMAAALMGSLVFTAAAEESAYIYEDDNVKIGEYKGLTYSAVKEEVTDEDVEEEMLDTLSYYADYEHLTDVEAKDEDQVNIDYTGTIDGEEFDGGSDTDTYLTIGDGLFLPEFEEGIIGMKAGETKEVEVTFPEDYDEEFAGKTAIFSITLNYVCGEEIVPELTDESIKEYVGYETVEDYAKDTRRTLEEDAESMYNMELQDEIFEQLMENCEVLEVPQELIDNYVNDAVEMYKSYAEMFGMEFEDFVEQMGGGDQETFMEELEEEGRMEQARTIVMAKIAELESIEVDDAAYEAYLEQLAEDYGYESVDALKEEVEASPGLEDSLRYSLLQEKVLNFLIENAVYVEAEEDDEELELEDDEFDVVFDEDEEPLDESEVLVEEEEIEEPTGEAILEGVEETTEEETK